MLAELRADLLTMAADPLPRQTRFRSLARLPHALVVAYAALMIYLADAYHVDPAIPMLATLQAVALMVALVRPVPAWWASIVIMVVGARTTVSQIVRSEPQSWIVPGKILQGDALSAVAPVKVLQAELAFPWTTPGIALQAAALFLAALRVPARVTAAMATITVVAGAVCATFPSPGNRPADALPALPAILVAAVAGAAVRAFRTTRTRLVEQEELTAEERARRTLLQERSRIARELHDVVAHHMSVISIQAQVAPHLVKDPPPELRENLDGIRANAVEALGELRRVLNMLREPDTLTEDAPQPALDRLDDLAAGVRAAGLELTTEIAGHARPLSPGVELTAFRIVQEALSNAMRHAPGAMVHVRVGYEATALTIRVTNIAPDGSAQAVPGAGHGLLGMRERAAMVGGELATGPNPGGGYEVTAILPLDLP